MRAKIKLGYFCPSPQDHRIWLMIYRPFLFFKKTISKKQFSITGPENQEIMDFCVWASKIMKSGSCGTKMKQQKSN